MKTRQMALTREMLARVHRQVEDAGPVPGRVHTDEDYDEVVGRVLASRPEKGDVLLFAYGSLIWRPEFEHFGEWRATARGWHRTFCYRITRFRGTEQEPGLMMALDRGGQCTGMVYRLAEENLAAQLGRLFRREFTVKPPNLLPRWITVEVEGHGTAQALAFVMNRHASAYVGRISLEEAAVTMTRACGHLGSCAEYLFNTVSHLEERGIHDRNLWRLQEMVAEKLAAHDTPDLRG